MRLPTFNGSLGAAQGVLLSSGKHKGKQILRWMQMASQALEERRKQEPQGTKSLLVELKLCRNLERGKQIHAVAVVGGTIGCNNVATALINMYAKCKSMIDARLVFDSTRNPNVSTWTALILGYAANGKGTTALNLFALMSSQGCAPNSFTFVAAVKACTYLAGDTARAECLERGRRIHSQIGPSHLDTHVRNALISMYSKCRSMPEAHRVFETTRQPTVVTWTALILGYAENGEGATALGLFERMRSEGCCEPDTYTFVAALKGCAALVQERRTSECLERGKQIHSQVGCRLNVYVQSILIDMYAKCGSMADARQVFDSIKQPNLVCWSALIMGYAENGEGATALDLFRTMVSQGCAPNSSIYMAALKACTCLAQEQDGAEGLELGKQIHSEIGRHSDVSVQNSLIDMYTKCGSMADARRVFESMEQPSVVSWNTLILGYAKKGEGVTALDLYASMRRQGGCAPDSFTFVAALGACSLVGDVELGRSIHAEIECRNQREAILVTCLVDFYAKCGDLVEARRVLDAAHPATRSLASWNALLVGYSRSGDQEAAFQVFGAMQDAGVRPNGVTFLCILTCCSYAGLVEKTSQIFDTMLPVHGIIPTVEHYTCMVDMLGRSNKLEDAMALLRSMPSRPDSVAWMTVLGACHKWKNVGIGTLAFRSLVSLDSSNAPAYVLMANVYGSLGMWEEQQMVLGMKRKVQASGGKPEQTCWTNEQGEVHTFLAHVSSKNDDHTPLACALISASE